MKKLIEKASEIKLKEDQIDHIQIEIEKGIESLENWNRIVQQLQKEIDKLYQEVETEAKKCYTEEVRKLTS